MGLGLQATCIAQTCRLPGTTIRLAPTAKGLPVLSLPLSPSFLGQHDGMQQRMRSLGHLFRERSLGIFSWGLLLEFCSPSPLACSSRSPGEPPH